MEKPVYSLYHKFLHKHFDNSVWFLQMGVGMRFMTFLGMLLTCLFQVAIAADGTATYYTPPYVRKYTTQKYCLSIYI